MSEALKQELAAHLKFHGAFDVGVADPRRGFEHSMPERHPLKLWPDCRAIVVFIVPRSIEANFTYTGPYRSAPNAEGLDAPPHARRAYYALTRQANLYTTFALHHGEHFLLERGFQVRDEEVQQKLCAYEAGLGVYGRSGLILHPVLGNRLSIETILTDAELPPDEPLKDFNPCGDCEGLCVKACPGRAYDPAKFYPESWTPAKCRVARGRLSGRGMTCGACWAVCPAGTIPDDWLIRTIRVESIFDRMRRGARAAEEAAN